MAEVAMPDGWDLFGGVNWQQHTTANGRQLTGFRQAKDEKADPSPSI